MVDNKKPIDQFVWSQTGCPKWKCQWIWLDSLRRASTVKNQGRIQSYDRHQQVHRPGKTKVDGLKMYQRFELFSEQMHVNDQLHRMIETYWKLLPNWKCVTSFEKSAGKLVPIEPNLTFGTSMDWSDESKKDLHGLCPLCGPLCATKTALIPSHCLGRSKERVEISILSFPLICVATLGHPYCWWFRNPANQLRLVVYPIIHRVSKTSQVVVWDFGPINRFCHSSYPKKDG